MTNAEALIRPELRDRILTARERLLAESAVPTGDELASILSLFRERFGPAALNRLEGEELLATVHNHSNRDSLVYWLEFKNDDEFPAVFGSIAGGSALKFGLYRRKETGAWMKGRSVDQKEVTTAEAIEIARRHRDQLVRGTHLLDEMSAEASLQDYQELQTAMDKEAPDVSRAAWGHKYFHLMHPELLDDFHVSHFQQYFLVKLLLRPPDGNTRYVASAFYAALQQELGIPMTQLTRALDECFGRPQKTWRLFCYYQSPDRDGWPMMRDGGWRVVRHAFGDQIDTLLHELNEAIAA
jgi:5-methylcytosine-specific restriction enzyme B